MSHWLATTNCYVCKGTFKEYQEEGYDVAPPCDTCFPGVHDYNKAAYSVYTDCSDQYIMGPNGAITLNAVAIRQSMEDFEIPPEDFRVVRQEVRQIANHVISTRRKQAEEEVKRLKKGK